MRLLDRWEEYQKPEDLLLTMGYRESIFVLAWSDSCTLGKHKRPVPFVVECCEVEGIKGFYYSAESAVAVDCGLPKRFKEWPKNWKWVLFDDIQE